MKTYQNIITLEPINSGGDGIRCYGDDNKNIVDKCYIDFSHCSPKILDENISFINGCITKVTNSVFVGGNKGALCGNGDYPEEDAAIGYTEFENCVFLDNFRRCPEAQHGVIVKLKNCIIATWGKEDRYKDIKDRSFGAWSHSGAKIYFDNCLFLQDKFFKNKFKTFMIDIGNHIGNDWNDRAISWKSLIPGVMRGAISTDHGKIIANNCYKNHSWIYVEGLTNRIKDTNVAKEMADVILRRCQFDSFSPVYQKIMRLIC